MHPLLKTALIVVAGLIAVVVVAVLLIVLLIDPNRFKPQLIAAVQQQTGRELRIDGDLGWSFYPVLGFELGSAELANAPGFSGEPMLAVRRIAVGVDLLPLISGTANVSQLRLEQPRINLAKDAQGRSNWDDILEHRRQLETQQPAAADEPVVAEEGRELHVAIAGLQLVEAAINWSDAQQQQNFQIAPVNLETGAIRSGEPVDLTLSLRVTSAQPALEGDLKLTATITADEAFETLAWDALKLALEAKGESLPARSLTAELSGGGRIDLQTQALRFSDGALTFSMPGLNGQFDAGGELRFNLRGDLEQQRFDSDDLVLKVTLDGSSLPGGTQTLTLRTPMALDLNRQTLSLPAVVASGAGIDLKARVDGSRIIDQPRFGGEIAIAKLPLRKLLNDLKVELPAMADANTLQNVALDSAFSATTERIELDRLKLVFDDSTLSGRLGAGLGEVTRIGFDLKLNRIDADRYLPAEEETAKPPVSAPAKAPAGTAADQTFAFLDTLALDGKLSIGELRIQGLQLRDVSTTVKTAGRTVAVDPLVAVLYGGRAEIRVNLDARGAQPQTRVRSSLQQIHIGALLDAWLQKPGPVEGRGNLNAELDFAGLDAATILGSLGGGGELRLADGAVRGLNVAQEIRNALAAVKRQPRQEGALKTDFTELVVPFKLSAGNFNWSQLSASSPLLRVGSSGAFNLLSQAVDTKLDVTVVQSLKGQGGEALGEVAGLLVPVTVRGTFDDPKISVDLLKVLEQTKLGAKKEELETELKEKAKAREDELKEKASKELQRGLQRLFKAPKEEAAPAE